MGQGCSLDNKVQLQAEVIDEERGSFDVASQDAAPRLPAGELSRGLAVTIVSARGMRNADRVPGTGLSDCYCVLRSRGRQLHRTRTINDSLSPVWNEEVNVEGYAASEPLEFLIFDEDIGRSDFLGKAFLDVGSLEAPVFDDELQLRDAGAGHMAYLRLRVRPKGGAPPASSPAAAFTCSLQKLPGKAAGLKVDTQDGVTVRIMDIADGPFRTFNQSAKPSNQLRKGDFIVRANGAEGSSTRILKQMQRDSSLELLVKRPEEFTIPVAKGAGTNRQKLGLEFKEPAGDSLVITKVTGGIMKEWNEQTCSLQVKVGDRITAVDGVSLQASELYKRLSGSGRFRVTLVRPKAPKSSWKLE